MTFTDKLQVSSSPHIRGSRKTADIMRDVIIALLPACCLGVYIYGINAMILLLVCPVSAMLFEFCWTHFTKRETSVGDFSAVLTGLLLAMNLPPTVPFWIGIVGSAFAVIVVKMFFGGIGNNFVNPALAARAFLLASYPVIMTTWKEPFAVDAMSGATPLAALNIDGMSAELPTYLDSFLGFTAGCIGETSAVLLLIGGLYLMIRGVIKPTIPAVFIGIVFIFSYILGLDPVYAILNGGLFLGAIFMATDYTTSPHGLWGQVIFAAGCGVLTVIIRKFGGYPEGVSYSILLMNCMVGLINKMPFARRA